jgi:hypothetical protein
MTDHRSFAAAFGLIYPVSDTMVQKCWRAMEKVPEPQREALVRALLEAATAAIVTRDAARAAITNSIGNSHP